MTGAGPAVSLSPIEALLDQWARVCLPYLTAQTCSLAGFGVFVLFCLVKWYRDGTFPSTDDCLRVALTTVTLRAVGLAVAVALFSYAGRTLGQVFSSSKREGG